LDHSDTHPLAYAPPPVRTGGGPVFRAGLIVFAALGLVANLAVIGLTVRSLHAAHWAYRDLKCDDHAFSRQIAPATIESLRRPVGLWVASGVIGLALTKGMLLAVHLLVAAWQIDRRPAAADRRLDLYRRFKPWGVGMTAVAYLWFSFANMAFWIAATRHSPLGGGPPIISMLIVIVLALVPCWWIRPRP
jgi:hypothetical protein